MIKKIASIATFTMIMNVFPLFADNDKDDNKAEKSEDNSTQQSKDDAPSSKDVDRDLVEALVPFDMMR